MQLPFYVTAFVQTGLFLTFFSLEMGQFRSTIARIGNEKMAVFLYILPVKHSTTMGEMKTSFKN